MDDPSNIALDELKRLPVPARGQCVPVRPVRMVVVRVPVPGGNARDQLRGHSVALDRQRVVGIALVDAVNDSQIGFRIVRQPRGIREPLEDIRSHGLPHRLDSAGYWRRASGQSQCTGRLVRGKRVLLPDVVSSCPHDAQDFIRIGFPANPSARPCQPAGNDRAPAFQQTTQDFRHLGDIRKYDAGLDRIAANESLRYTHQSRGRGVQPQTVSNGQVRSGRLLFLLQVEDRCSERQADPVVPSPRAVHDQPCGDDGVVGVQQEGLLGRKVPSRLESRLAVASAELPERRVPRCAVANVRAGIGRN